MTFEGTIAIIQQEQPPLHQICLYLIFYIQLLELLLSN